MKPTVWKVPTGVVLSKYPPQQHLTTTPRQVQANVNNVPEAKEDERTRKRWRRGLFLKCLLVALAVLLILAAAVVPVVVLLTMSTTTTTTTTGITTTVTCATGYTQTPSGSCVNTQIDFNNCGSVGYVCSSNYTSCSAGVCSVRPAVVLPGAIAVPGFNTSIGNIDDVTAVVILPLNITLYNYTTSNITVTTNGVVCLGACSNVWTNTILPSSSFGGPTVFGYWDDLMIYTGTSQTVYYAVSGSAPNRVTTFEFYESHFTSSTQYYHFQVIFYENLPNIVKCVYFDMSSGGATGTIGVQESGSGSFIQHAFNQAGAVSYNDTLIFDTNTGTYTG